MTASGCVPCESLMNRTPSTTATGSSRCSTPVKAAAAPRIPPTSTPNASATAIAARAFETLCAPGIASSATGMIRPGAGARPSAASAAGQAEPRHTVGHDPAVHDAEPAGGRPVAPVADRQSRRPGRRIAGDDRVLGVEDQRARGVDQLGQARA